MTKLEETDRGGVDARVRRSREAVLAATNELMSESGIGGVSVDEVSRRSGVAKTTIYRHWPSRSALLLDACSRLGARPPAPDTGSLKGDLVVLVGYLAEQLASARWPSILPSIVDAAERDPDIAAMHARLQAGFAAAYLAVIERAKARGEIAAQHPTDIVAGVLGPLFYRRWFSREPIDQRFAHDVVTRMVKDLEA
jgi:AcrR family transcriptional regulator